ncbi:putative histone acetyltransferase [Leptomonas pyrrhocoris]|uniref:Putative histone acetyltransferase n=1 Tax=Leptomonas pyrrhocoris TaxID=157538 RepID=A0A0M9G997_LEPPY|nr:putative histone acetyltransferase [Leptomonas pyrrhocoris]KPA85189.1 putative histone acetyltransferase [Leptomonas pyrrhocoris]|eukprot:XP_015663628.1 putative histone acetyltransferase [Leptomonas pyrrhocoris]
MRRDSGAQEVSCAVALPVALYPALLHRKLPTNAGTTSTAGTTGAVGGEHTGGHPQEACVPGVILEVRQLWQSTSNGGRNSVSIAAAEAAGPSPSSPETSDAFHLPTSSSPAFLKKNDTASSATEKDSLYAFVRIKDADHRLSGWFPLHRVYVKLDSAVLAFGDSAVSPHDASVASGVSEDVSASAAARGLSDDWTPLARVLRRPWLSDVYDEVTPGMARTQRAHRQLDYLEERLLRDCRTPTTVRYFVYLNNYVFAPWYYAPFGLLNSEYDPTLPCGASAQQQNHAASADGAVAKSCIPQPQPYIRDAFLCPFSLRIFSTFAQLHYETRSYRAGRLRPPGEEIYRDERRGLSLFRINGSQHVTYCRQLFLIGKSFLENKLAGHDVHSYYFYVVCLHHRYFPSYVSDESAMFFAGFFTWEKQVIEYNLACIATLPCFGRRVAPRPPPLPAASPLGNPARGQVQSDVSASSSAPPPVLRNIGQFMIAVSYELAYRRKQIGTPEKPLSDLGAVAYQHYWRRALVRWMKATLNEMRRAAAVDVDGVAAVASSEKRRDEHQPPDVSLDVVAVFTEDERNEADNSDGGNGKTGRWGFAAGTRKRARRAAAAAAAAAANVVEVGEDDDAEVAEGDENHDDDYTSAGNARRRQLPAPLPMCASPTKPAWNAAAIDNESSSPTTFTGRTTIKEIAAAVRLEEADVLKTLLGLGVLHHSSEDRSIQLLLPQRYVDWMYDEMLRWEGSATHAVFEPALLRSRGRTK